jgi:predicted phosphodiesterase
MIENANKKLLVGVISDTHGLLRPEAVEALRGSDRILHAGDVGDPKILEALARIAPSAATSIPNPGRARCPRPR